MRRLLLTSLIGTLCLAATGGSGAASQAGASRWLVTDLGNLGRPATVVAADINDRGQIVGQAVNAGGQQRGFVWQGGKMKPLGAGKFASASAINERGEIVGASSFPDGQEHAVLWAHGRMRDLGRPNEASSAGAINRRGQVLGSYNVPFRSGFASRSFFWANGVRHPLVGSKGLPITAWALNDRGQVAGVCCYDPSRVNQPGDLRAVLWQDGAVTDLGQGSAADVNEHGWAVGDRTTDTGAPRAALWHDGTTIDLGALNGARFSSARAINDRNEVIGIADGRGFLWRRGTLVDLGTLGGQLTVPTAISNGGRVIGYSTVPSGATHAFVWEGGTMTDLGLLKGRRDVRAVALNEHGQIIGDTRKNPDLRGGPGPFGVLWTIRRGTGAAG